MDGSTVDDLLRNADMAMYRAKVGGRGRFVYCEADERSDCGSDGT